MGGRHVGIGEPQAGVRAVMQLDEDRAFLSDPPWWNEYELYNELWSLTRIALRNWLKGF